MTNDQVRIGFLGTGFIATYHSKSLKRGGANIVRAGVYDPDADRAQAFCNASGHVRCDSEDEVIASADAVYVCTWTSEHRRLVEKVIAAGKAVFCEKPLSPTLAEAEQLVSGVNASGVINQVGLVLRHAPSYLWARELIAEKNSGRVMNVVFRDDQFIPIQSYYASDWRKDVSRAGAGTLLEHSIHDVDMLHFLIGDITDTSMRSKNFHGYPGIEDSVSATMQFSNGAVGTLSSIWHDNLTRPSQRSVEIFCENRTITIRGHEWFGPVEWHDSDGTSGSLGGDELLERTKPLAVGDTNPDCAFVQAVATNTPAYPDVNVALRAHIVVAAMYSSAANDGCNVSVNA
ncbi:MAG: gfo/Idh/MocA family oxidoreductase [Actinobacteria bacterium]|nr:MAG: gfo/Idh/MocA family oxidoreductase [Actinomycetota bacterium]